MWRRLVILSHDHPFVHWDLLLEGPSSARTWRLLRRPCPDEPIAAEPLPDHRLHYLTYEGTVSGDRGHVHRIAEGFYAPLSLESETEVLAVLGLSFGSRLTFLRITDGRQFVQFSGDRSVGSLADGTG